MLYFSIWFDMQHFLSEMQNFCLSYVVYSNGILMEIYSQILARKGVKGNKKKVCQN